MSLITSRPAPESNGKPNSPLPRLGTHTSGVVTRKDSVPSVMIMANVSPISPTFGKKIPRNTRIPILMMSAPNP